MGATVILGTGTGIAFFMLMAHRSGDAAFIARTAGLVVLADMIFTATAVILQPITGAALAFPFVQAAVNFLEADLDGMAVLRSIASALQLVGPRDGGRVAWL